MLGAVGLDLRGGEWSTIIVITTIVDKVQVVC